MTHHENPALTLAAHHQHLDATFDDLLRAVETGDPQDLQSTWADFARELRSHLGYEERAVLPAFERDAPHEAAVVRREHAEIEAALGNLERSLDRGGLQARAAKDFVAQLRRHAHKEEQTVYAWASSHRPAAGWEILPTRLARAANPTQLATGV